VDAEYVGHPIIEEISIKCDKHQFGKMMNLNPDKKWISFFPGSRKDEVEKLLPIYLKTISLMNKNHYEFMISRASTIRERDFMDLLNRNYDDLNQIKIVSSNNYEMMKHSDFSVIKSGTSTLEAAYIGTPYLICYKANPISYWIGKKIVKIKFIGLPNILMNRMLVPEFIQNDVNPQKLKEKIESTLDNETLYQMTKENLSEIQQVLGKKSASKQTARLILDLLRRT